MGIGEGGRIVVIATRNAGKRRELGPLLEAAGYVTQDLEAAGIAESAAEDELECHATFEENALAKARYFSALLPGVAVLADDSGLSVDALGGAPGVRSKRWAAAPGLSGRELDAANNARLLRELSGVEDRGARFVCAAAWVGGEGESVARGEVQGRILEERRGEAGFGYDPYFWSEELGRGFGESSREEKATVSHRARAVRALLASLAAREGVLGPGVD